MTATEPWRFLSRPGFQARPLRVCIAGGGASGICLAIKILDALRHGTLERIEIVIYEREDDFAGTWYVNRYPGCRCDIPSHVYQFSFAPNAAWSKFYSPADEINAYLHNVAQKYGVVPFIHLKHAVVGAHYEDDKWRISVSEDGGAPRDEIFDVYVPATGVLSQVNRPKIKGLETFTKKPVLHTAEWPKHLDYTTAFADEKVGVIGIGSSGVQVVGTMAPYTKEVNVFARSKFWTSPPFMADPAGEREWVSGNFDYGPEERKLYARDPVAFREHTAALTAASMFTFEVCQRGSPSQQEVRRLVRESMHKELRGRQDLIDKLIPDFDVWCRRVTPCTPFMEALHSGNTNLITDPILEVVPEGIKTATGVVELDRIILATGFDTTFRPRYDIVANGKSLADVWSKSIEAYMSIAVPSFPNLFMMCGPGTIFANGSLLAGIEGNADYIVKLLDKLQREDIKSLEVDADATREYNEQQQSLMSTLVFSDSCSSWYKGGDAAARPHALFAGSTLAFLQMLSRPRWEDWHSKSLYKNRFSFLGDGTGTVEENGGDRAYFIKVEDHVDPLGSSRGQRPVQEKEAGQKSYQRSGAL